MPKCSSYCNELNQAPLCSPGQQAVNSKEDCSLSKCKWDLAEREIFLKVSFEEEQTEARQRLGARKITAGAVRKGS